MTLHLPESPSLQGMMPIGRFARLSGLSIGALRHYAETGLLEPARVDAQTGYRYYDDGQLPAARRIAALRTLDVPLKIIRELRDADPEAFRRGLARYRASLDAAIWQLQRRAHRLDHFDLWEDQIMPTPPFILDPDDERRLAATLFNRVWDYLEKPDRARADDDAMLHAAHASRHHWGAVGGPVQWARGEWQISRVYSVLGRAEPALHHGQRCLDLVEEHGLEPFDLGYAHEALARGYRVADRPTDAARHLDMARAAAGKVADPEERELLVVDLSSL